MLTLYGNRLALFSVKVELLAAEARLPYTLVDVDIFRMETASPDFRRLAPFGRVPVIDDDGLLLGESNAILRHLATRWNLDFWYPQDRSRRALVDQWLDFGLIHLCFPLSQLFVYRWISPRFPGWPMDVARCSQMDEEISRYMPFVERRLGDSPYLAGDHPTLADLALAPFVAVGPAIGVPLSSERPTLRCPRRSLPATTRWLARMVARPAFASIWDARLPAPETTTARVPLHTSAIDRILEFWFDGHIDGRLPSAMARAWFGGADPELDACISEEFGADVDRAARGHFDVWRETPRGSLALIILLDQFTRHVRRGTAQAYANDAHALAACLEGLARGQDSALSPFERAFFYLPLQHAEDPAMQRRSVERYAHLRGEALSTFRFLALARRHRAVVDRFGRFPHRNGALGRPSTPEELRFLREEDQGW